MMCIMLKLFVYGVVKFIKVNMVGGVVIVGLLVMEILFIGLCVLVEVCIKLFDIGFLYLG